MLAENHWSEGIQNRQQTEFPFHLLSLYRVLLSTAGPTKTAVPCARTPNKKKLKFTTQTSVQNLKAPPSFEASVDYSYKQTRKRRREEWSSLPYAFSLSILLLTKAPFHQTSFVASSAHLLHNPKTSSKENIVYITKKEKPRHATPSGATSFSSRHGHCQHPQPQQSVATRCSRGGSF